MLKYGLNFIFDHFQESLFFKFIQNFIIYKFVSIDYICLYIYMYGLVRIIKIYKIEEMLYDTFLKCALCIIFTITLLVEYN